MATQYEQRMAVRAEEAFGALRPMASEVQETAARVTDLLSRMRVQRDAFLQDGASLVNAEDPSFASRFEAPEQYYEFLAHTGCRTEDDPRGVQTLTERTAGVIADLHTPDAPVFLKTYQRSNRLIGTQYAIGRIVGTPKPRLIPSGIWAVDNDLILSVETTSVAEGPKTSEVGIQGISDRVNPRVTPGTASPFVAVGADAVGRQVQYLFDAGHNKVVPQQDRTCALTALSIGGLKLSELGVDDARIGRLRNYVIGGIAAAVKGNKRYDGDILLLPAVAGPGESPFEVVADIVGNDKPHEIDYSFARDYRLLRNYYAPSPDLQETS